MAIDPSLRFFVVSCERDRARRAAAMASVLSFGYPCRWIKAVDARDGIMGLAPYAHLVRDDFWGSPQIKPGALACFVSHRLAWQTFLDSGAEFGAFMEDDSTLIERPHLGRADLCFLNDRLIGWAQGYGHSSVRDLVQSLGTRAVPKDQAKAPGADGYMLSRHGAEMCLAQSERDGVRCGVDWYLLMLAGGTSDEGQACPEVADLVSMFGRRAPQLDAEIAPTSAVKNGQHWVSSIGHSTLIEISDLKTQLV